MRVKRPAAAAVALTKEDRALQALTRLKTAQRLWFGSDRVFLSNKDMTVARKRKVGLYDNAGLPRTSVESARFRANQLQLPNGEWGYVVGPRSGIAAPKQPGRPGVIRRR